MVEIGGVKFKESPDGLLKLADAAESVKVTQDWVRKFRREIFEATRKLPLLIHPLVIGEGRNGWTPQLSELGPSFSVVPGFANRWHQDGNADEGTHISTLLANFSRNNQRGSTLWRSNGVCCGSTPQIVRIDWSLHPETLLIFNNFTGEHCGDYRKSPEAATQEDYLCQGWLPAYY